MRDARGEPADRVELLPLAQLEVDPLARDRRREPAREPAQRAALGAAESDAAGTVRRAVLTRRGRARLEGDHAPQLPLDEDGLQEHRGQRVLARELDGLAPREARRMRGVRPRHARAVRPRRAEDRLPGEVDLLRRLDTLDADQRERRRMHHAAHERERRGRRVTPVDRRQQALVRRRGRLDELTAALGLGPGLQARVGQSGEVGEERQHLPMPPAETRGTRAREADRADHGAPEAHRQVDARAHRPAVSRRLAGIARHLGVLDVDGQPGADHLPGMPLLGGALGAAALGLGEALRVDELEPPRAGIHEVDARVLDREELLGERLDEPAEFVDGAHAREGRRRAAVEFVAGQEPAVARLELRAGQLPRQQFAEARAERREGLGLGRGRRVAAHEHQHAVHAERHAGDRVPVVGSRRLRHADRRERFRQRIERTRRQLRPEHRDPLERAIARRRRTPDPDLASVARGRERAGARAALGDLAQPGRREAWVGDEGLELRKRHGAEGTARAVERQSGRRSGTGDRGQACHA